MTGRPPWKLYTYILWEIYCVQRLVLTTDAWWLTWRTVNTVCKGPGELQQGSRWAPQTRVMKHLITSLAVISLVSYPFIVTLTQWLHEESLILPDSHYPWVGPQRSVLLTTIKKVEDLHTFTLFDTSRLLNCDSMEMVVCEPCLLRFPCSCWHSMY